jgi:hypothetical protein
LAEVVEELEVQLLQELQVGLVAVALVVAQVDLQLHLKDMLELQFQEMLLLRTLVLVAVELVEQAAA